MSDFTKGDRMLVGMIATGETPKDFRFPREKDGEGTVIVQLDPGVPLADLIAERDALLEEAGRTAAPWEEVNRGIHLPDTPRKDIEE